MYEIRALNPDAVNAELAYRRSLLVGRPTVPVQARARWWRRRGPVND